MRSGGEGSPDDDEEKKKEEKDTKTMISRVKMNKKEMK
jgi:hypothetical protein